MKKKNVTDRPRRLPACRPGTQGSSPLSFREPLSRLEQAFHQVPHDAVEVGWGVRRFGRRSRSFGRLDARTHDFCVAKVDEEGGQRVGAARFHRTDLRSNAFHRRRHDERNRRDAGQGEHSRLHAFAGLRDVLRRAGTLRAKQEDEARPRFSLELAPSFGRNGSSARVVEQELVHERGRLRKLGTIETQHFEVASHLGGGIAGQLGRALTAFVVENDAGPLVAKIVGDRYRKDEQRSTLERGAVEVRNRPNLGARRAVSSQNRTHKAKK